jgi:hypothetical protein
MVIVVFNGTLSTIILHVHNDSTFPAEQTPKISTNVGTCVGITHGTHGIAQGSGGIKHKLSSPPKAYDYSTCNEAIIPRHTVP